MPEALSKRDIASGFFHAPHFHEYGVYSQGEHCKKNESPLNTESDSTQKTQGFLYHCDCHCLFRNRTIHVVIYQHSFSGAAS